MSLNDTLLLVRHGYVPHITRGTNTSMQHVGTIVANMASLGYAPNKDALEHLASLDTPALAAWWKDVSKALKKAKGANVKMNKFVVYKNFPKEVLDKSEGEYWIAQILMYLGFENDLFTQHPLPRAPLDERLDLSVLALQTQDTHAHIQAKLVGKKVDWTPQNQEDAVTLFHTQPFSIDFATFGTRMNAAWLGARFPDFVVVNAPTDVLRVIAAHNKGDVSLRTPTRVKLNRPWRRRCITWLNTFSQSRLEEDFVAREGSWKKVLHALHAGQDTQALGRATRALRDGSLKTFDARVEYLIKTKDTEALDLVATRPGMMMRQLHRLYTVFGADAFARFAQEDVLDALTIAQIVSLDTYLKTVPGRASFYTLPNGQAKKAQVRQNTKEDIAEADMVALRQRLANTLKTRLKDVFPKGVDLDARLHNAKLPGMGQEDPRGRGSVLTIPEGKTFLRTASYWENKSDYGNVWFDNGWTFFDETWTQVDATTWDHTKTTSGQKPYGVFSGDPTNFKEKRGRACQMIDIYFDRMEKSGARYGVWSVLCYSHIPFSQAKKVLATLQWGDAPEKGKLYEPARAQIVLPLTGDDKDKVVAVLDAKTRKLHLVDMAMGLAVSSALRNRNKFEANLEALMEDITARPSYYDVFAHAPKGEIPVKWDDADEAVTGKGFVLNRVNGDSQIEEIDVEQILARKA